MGPLYWGFDRSLNHGQCERIGCIGECQLFPLPSECDKVKKLARYCCENEYIEVYQAGKLWMKK